MSVKLPDGASVWIANGLAAEKKITAVTAANPPVATCAAHGLESGDFVVFHTGWGDFDERVVKVEKVNNDSFKLLGLDASDAARYAAAEGVGGFQKVSAWTRIRQVLSASFSGGEQQYANYSFLDENFERQIPTTVSASSATFSIADDISQAGYKAAKIAADKRQLCPLRLDLAGGSQIVYNGYPSLNEIPSLEKGAVMAVTLSYALSGKPTRY